jgi:ankyrin repeat protein
LLGPNYANYKVQIYGVPGHETNEHQLHQLNRLKVRLRCIKNSEYTLAKYLKLTQDIAEHVDPVTNNEDEDCEGRETTHGLFGDSGDARVASQLIHHGIHGSSPDNDIGCRTLDESSLTGRAHSNHFGHHGSWRRLQDRATLRERFSRTSMTSSILTLALSAKRLSNSTCRTSLSQDATPPPSTKALEDQTDLVPESMTPSSKRDIRAVLMKLYPSITTSSLSKEANEMLHELIDIQSISESSQKADGLSSTRYCCDLALLSQKVVIDSLAVEHSLIYEIAERHQMCSKMLDSSFCRVCDIRGIHLLAYAGESIPKFVTSETLELTDIYGNRPLHFAAGCSKMMKKYASMMDLLIRVPVMKAIATNKQGRTFLHTLNPLIGQSDGSLWNTVARAARHIKSVYPGYDFNARDYYGQTFWDCIGIDLAMEFRRPLYGDQDNLARAVRESLAEALHETGALSLTHQPLSTGEPVENSRENRESSTWWQDSGYLYLSGLNDIPLLPFVRGILSLDPDSRRSAPVDVGSSRDTALISFVRYISEQPCSLPRSRINEIIYELLGLGVPLEARDSRGESALYIAARLGQPNLVRILLDHDAEYGIVNYDDMSLCAATRAAILEARKEDTLESVRKEADLLACLVTILDYEWRDPLPETHQYAD